MSGTGFADSAVTGWGLDRRDSPRADAPSRGRCLSFTLYGSFTEKVSSFFRFASFAVYGQAETGTCRARGARPGRRAMRGGEARAVGRGCPGGVRAARFADAFRRRRGCRTDRQEAGGPGGNRPARGAHRRPGPFRDRTSGAGDTGGAHGDRTPRARPANPAAPGCRRPVTSRAYPVQGLLTLRMRTGIRSVNRP
jgi:hypothetical protein